jgi:hypothetical protein
MRRYLIVGVPAFGFAGMIFFIAVVAPWALRRQPYMHPSQPITFNHRIHVEGLGMDCAFCHRTAATGDVAGYPDLQQCIFCHQVVNEEIAQQIRLVVESPPLGRGGERVELGARRAEMGRSQIEQVRQSWVEQEPINWVRRHRLPDHTVFPHDAHVRAGVSCATCHGNVAQMRTAVKVRPLNMSDCVACHQETNAPTDCFTCHQ